MFVPSIYKSVQQIVTAFSAGWNYYNLSPAVISANSILLFSRASYGASGFPSGEGSAAALLVSGSQVGVYSYFGGGECTITVTELYPGFLRQAVQHQFVANAGGGYQHIGIPTVGPKAYVIMNGITESKFNVQTDMASQTARVQLTNTTTASVVRVGTGGLNAPDNAYIGFCVVDPK